MDIKVGQVWQDKDKRRNTVIEIIGVGTVHNGIDADSVVGLIVGTEEEREYRVDRLVKRWVMTKEAPEPEAPKPAEVKAKYKTREQWLVAAIDALTKKVFKPNKFEVPEVRVSVGWPGGRGSKKNVIGQCFPTESTGDKTPQIFVSPVVEDALSAVIVIAHELVHAVDDCKNGHKADFIKIAKQIGFIPKWTVATTEVITDEFKETLEAIVERLGAYPHSAIHPTDKPTVQKTYMLKVMCVEDDDYFVRMTAGKIEEYGTPKCPCHNKTMEVEEK